MRPAPNPRQGGVAPCRRQPGLMWGRMAAGRPGFVVQAGLWPFLTQDCPRGGERGTPARDLYEIQGRELPQLARGSLV